MPLSVNHTFPAQLGLSDRSAAGRRPDKSNTTDLQNKTKDDYAVPIRLVGYTEMSKFARMTRDGVTVSSFGNNIKLTENSWHLPWILRRRGTVGTKDQDFTR